MMAVMQGIAGVHGRFNQAIQRTMTFRKDSWGMHYVMDHH